MAKSDVFRFFDLPPELRSAILTQLLVSDSTVVLHSATLFSPPLSELTGILNVFLVSTQMYQEASAVFYAENGFILNAQSHRLPAHLTGQGGFLSEEGQHARRRVRKLTVYLTRVGGEFERVLGPALEDMVLNGSLRDLSLYLGPPSWRARANRSVDPDMVQRPPFQALLRLLSDPYLEKVEFLAWRVHMTVFCPFHQKKRPSTKTDHESVDDEGLAVLRDGPDWVELDWRALVEVYGTGQPIVRIGERSY